jgi:NAD(P)-dependent dehydrogenase (short-subunit alcohol dehydrogenase family)
MNNGLENNRALITGVSRGIGAATVKRPAREGVDVAFTPPPARSSSTASRHLPAVSRRIPARHGRRAQPAGAGARDRHVSGSPQFSGDCPAQGGRR